jgi:hypothetical protein
VHDPIVVGSRKCIVVTEPDHMVIDLARYISSIEREVAAVVFRDKPDD